MQLTYQIGKHDNFEGLEVTILTLLYGPIISKLAFFLYFHLKNQSKVQKKSEQLNLQDLLQILQIKRTDFEQPLKELQEIKLMEWKYSKKQAKYVFNLKKPKSIQLFFKDRKLTKQLEQKLVPLQIEKIQIFAKQQQLTKKAESVNVWTHLTLPTNCKKNAKLRDLRIIDKIYCENSLTISILQKIIDFVILQTKAINSNYIEKMIQTLKEKKILNDEDKLTEYLINIFQNKTVHEITAMDQFKLPEWLMPKNYDFFLENHLRFKKLFNN